METKHTHKRLTQIKSHKLTYTNISTISSCPPNGPLPSKIGDDKSNHSQHKSTINALNISQQKHNSIENMKMS